MKKQLKITAPIPPSVNSYLKYRVQRNGRKLFVQAYKSAEAVTFENVFKPIVQDAIRKQEWEMPKKEQFITVEADYYFPRGRMDANNHWKLPLDVFSAVGVYLDDDKVMERVGSIYIDKHNPRVEYTITLSDKVGIFENEAHADIFAKTNCINCSKQINKCSIFKEALNNKINKENIELENNVCYKIKIKKNK